MNIIKKRAKKLISLIIACALIASMVPTSVFATGESGNVTASVAQGSSHFATPADPSDTLNYPQGNDEGYVRMKKSAIWTNEEKTTANVMLDSWGKGIVTGVDAVVIIDRSGSMVNGKVTTIIPEVRCEGKLKFLSKHVEYKYECAGRRCYSKMTKLDDGSLGGTNHAECRRNGTWELVSQSNIHKYECDDCSDVRQNDGNQDLEGTVCNKILKKETSITKSRMDFAREAAAEFVNTMFAKEEGNKNKVGLVSFSHDDNGSNHAKVESGLVDAQSKAVLDKAIKDMAYPNGGTNYTAAFEAAKNLINTEDDRPDYIIFLTDGAPGYSGGSAGDSNWDGTVQAKTLKEANVKIHSIAFNLGTSKDEEKAKTLLKGQISSPTTKEDSTIYFHNVSDATKLTETFIAIAGDLRKAGTKIVITDKINAEKFKFDASKKITVKINNVEVPADSVSFDEATGTITANFKEITQDHIVITIPIVLKVDEKGAHATNDADEKAKIEYKNFRDYDCEQSVESPVLSKPFGMINIEMYKVDKDGDAVDDNGNKLTFEDRISIGTKYAWENPNPADPGDPTAIKSGVYTVTPKDRLVTVGGRTYKLATVVKEPGKAESASVEVLDNGICEVSFGYVETKQFKVTYDKNHVDATLRGDKIVEVIENETVGDREPTATNPGYTFEGWFTKNDGKPDQEFTKDTRVTMDITAYAKWAIDNGQWATYTIKYYKDTVSKQNYIGEVGPSEKVIVPKDVTLTTAQVGALLSKAPGYAYNGGVITTALVGGKDTVINVVYSKDDSQIRNYTIKYHKDGVYMGVKEDKNGTVPIHTPIVTANMIPTTNMPDGYKNSPVVTDVEINTDSQVINVYYVIDNSKWATYTIKYYKNSTAEGNYIGEDGPSEKLLVSQEVTLTTAQVEALLS